MKQYNDEHRGDDWIVRYQTLLDSLNIGFTLIDMEENILEVNDTILKMTGAQRADLVGKNNRDFYSKEDLDFMVKIGKSLQKHGKYQYEYFIPTASGEKIPVLFNSSLNFDDDGNPETVSTMITDIREQKKIQKALIDVNRDLTESRDTLEREKKKLETILFGIGDIVSIFDTAGGLLLRNPRGDLIYGHGKTPTVPLEAGAVKNQVLTVNGEERHFFGHVEKICDSNGVPFAYVEILKDITEQIKYREQSHELQRMKRELKRYNLKTDMISNSTGMHRVFDLILRCSEVYSTVLILGETGVGKEMVAHAIHNNSSRKDRPFCAINCGALPESLLESELFGHTKGAFTGAIAEREGLFREANGSTIFLDEIGDISEPMQIKLLRALQEKEIRPLGTSKTYSVDVRIIAATNRDLQQLIEERKFRKDLYYRIAVIPLHIPPLRNRKDDILPLARHFIKKYNDSIRFKHVSLHHSTQQKLLDFDWPGNIRELENSIEHALAMATGPVILPQDLPVHIITEFTMNEDDRAQRQTHIPYADSEKERILNALKCGNSNRSLTARNLGISRTTLWRKLVKYKIS